MTINDRSNRHTFINENVLLYLIDLPERPDSSQVQWSLSPSTGRGPLVQLMTVMIGDSRGNSGTENAKVVRPSVKRQGRNANSVKTRTNVK